jgi:hypothetical protein
MAPQTLKKARERLAAAADRMAERLLGMAESDKIPSYVALQAINSALDRAGVSEPKQVDVTVKPFEHLFGDLTAGTRADYRRSIGDGRADDQPPAIENHHRPGPPPVEASGVRVLGELPDGSLVIDGEVVGDDQDELEPVGMTDDPDDGSHVRRETLANRVTPLTPVRGYLPADEAMTVAAEANRTYRRGLSRR